jgi:hypothetical protein
MFVKDRFLTLQLSKQDQLIRLPWDQIASIQGKNGGFKHDLAIGGVGGMLHARPIVYDLEEALQSGVQTTAADSIGFTGGRLLSEACGAILLPRSVFHRFELLGMDKLSEPEFFLSPEDEKEWLLAIAQDERSLEMDDLIPFHEALIYESIPKVDVEPETFDYVAIADEP